MICCFDSRLLQIAIIPISHFLMRPQKNCRNATIQYKSSFHKRTYAAVNVKYNHSEPQRLVRKLLIQILMGAGLREGAIVLFASICFCKMTFLLS